MNAFSDVIDSPSFSTQDFISDQLQQVFLPFPLSLVHFLPRWVLETTVTIIGALLIKVFMDPAIAVCNLCRASSLSIVDKLTTIFVPTVSIFRKHQREAAFELGEATMRKMEARSEIPDVRTIDAETQNLSTPSSENKRENQ